MSERQLTLRIGDSESPAATTLPPRIRPMQPTPGPGPFDDADYLFEPWWPGTRAIAFVERGAVRLQAEQLSDPLASFPELRELPALVVADGLALDGVLLVLDDGGVPDTGLLRRRLEHARERRGQPAFVVSDLLYLGGRSLTAQAFAERRRLLQQVMPADAWAMVGRAFGSEGTTLAAALAAFGFGHVSARRLDARYRGGPAGDAWLRLPLAHDPAAAGRRPVLTLIQRLPL